MSFKLSVYGQYVFQDVKFMLSGVGWSRSSSGCSSSSSNNNNNNTPNFEKYNHVLQAGEVDVLNAVLKWGEHQLMKRMEEREPNLLTHTAHSVSKKGVKKRDLNDMELRRDILADLLAHVRTDHIIPANNEILNR